jgi:hypothetical protein
MTWDFTIKATDVIMIFAIYVGPIVAVWITERLRKNEDKRNRKVHIYRTLMATRTANLSFQHVEALNLVETEFSSGNKEDNEVISSWKLYLSHLNDKNYPQESWGARRADLLVDLLHEMSRALGYGYDKAAIKAGSYYPQGYGSMEEEQQALRKGWLNVLAGRPINMAVTSFPYSEEAANLQQEVHEALLESLSDKRIVKVSIVNHDNNVAATPREMGADK